MLPCNGELHHQWLTCLGDRTLRFRFFLRQAKKAAEPSVSGLNGKVIRIDDKHNILSWQKGKRSIFVLLI